MPFGGDVLPGKPPVLMQDLALETAESRLNSFRLTAVGSGRPVDMADLCQQTIRHALQFLMTALVVMNQLVRLVPACLECHAVSMVLRFVILVLADMETQQHLAVGIHDLVHADGTNIAVFILVVEVQLRTVTVPQAVAAAGKLGLVLTAVTLVRLHLPIDRIIPQRLDTGAVKPFTQAAGTFQGFPATLRGNTIVFLEICMSV